MKKAVFALSICCAIFVGCSAGEINAEDGEKHSRFELVLSENPSYSSYSEIIVDTETGVMYLAYKYYRGSGVTVMLDADGNPLIWDG